MEIDTRAIFKQEIEEDPDKELLEKLESDPLLFIETFLRRSLSEKQQFFINSTTTHKHIIAIWSRQSGKSTIIASYLIWRLLYGQGETINGEKIVEHIAVLAPIKDQIINLFKKIKTLINNNEFISQFVVKCNSEWIVMKNGNEINFMSASPGAHIRGYTATCIVIDESQDIQDEKYTGDILPFGATTNPLILEAGTPKTKNHFYNSIQDKNTLVVKQLWFECPFLSEEYVMAQKESSSKALWEQEFLCKFMEEGVLAFPSVLFNEDTVGNYKVYDRINDIDFEKVKDLVANGATYSFGIDVGKVRDPTVLAILRTDLRPIRVEALISFTLGTKYTDIAIDVGKLYTLYQPYKINLDYTNEKGFVEMLMDQGVSIIVNKKNTEGAISFTNKNKTEMVTTAKVLLEKKAWLHGE